MLRNARKSLFLHKLIPRGKMKRLIALISFQLVTLALAQQDPMSRCFNGEGPNGSDLYRETPTWTCRYSPQQVTRPELFQFILDEYNQEFMDNDTLDIRQNETNNSIYIRTTDKSIADGIKARIPIWDSNKEIIKRLPSLKIKVDFYVLSEEEINGFKLGIQNINKNVKEAANNAAETDDQSPSAESQLEGLSQKGFNLLLSGGTAGVGAVLGNSMKNLSISIGRRRQKRKLRIHLPYTIEHADRANFNPSHLAQVDISAPNRVQPQIVQLGVDINGKFRLMGGPKSKLVDLSYFSFQWTRPDNEEKGIYSNFRNETYNKTIILGVPQFLATAEVNEYSRGKDNNLLSIDQESKSVKKKLAVVVTVYRADDPIESEFGKYETVQKIEFSDEQIAELPSGETDCQKIQNSIQTKVVRDTYGIAKLLLKASPDVLTQKNKDQYINLVVSSKGNKSGKKVNNIKLKYFAYKFQNVYKVTPEKEKNDFLDLSIKAQIGEKGKVCKFKRRANYNIADGELQLAD